MNTILSHCLSVDIRCATMTQVQLRERTRSLKASMILRSVGPSSADVGSSISRSWKSLISPLRSQ